MKAIGVPLLSLTLRTTRLKSKKGIKMDCVRVFFDTAVWTQMADAMFQFPKASCGS
jgi:hypothetical protein